MAEFDDIFSTPTPEASAEPQRITNDQFDKEAWAQKKRDERDGLFTMVDERAVEVSIDTNAFVQFLDVQSRFMRMSTNNALLVAAQCPNATRLASFDSWKEQNVDILAGEKAISIFSPGDTYTKQDGTDGRYMNVSKVFDISQTSADKPVNPPAPDIRDLLRAVSANSGTRIEMVDELPDNRPAVYQSENNTLFVSRGMDGEKLFVAITGELARASMLRDGIPPNEASAASHLSAELLCRKYGVDTSKLYNVEQLRIGSFGKGSKAIREEFGRARRAAEGISYNMEKTLNPPQRADKSTEPR